MIITLRRSMIYQLLFFEETGDGEVRVDGEGEVMGLVRALSEDILILGVNWLIC